jgi:hypothetical protein
MKRLIIAVAITGTMFGAAHAQSSPFAGVWKLDVAKSKFTGDTFTYTKTPTGYEFSNGGPITYAFGTDGKDYPMMAGRTTSWTASGPGAWDVVFKIDGKVVTKAHRVISPDGKTMTTTYIETRPDGTSTSEKDVYQRISAGKGIVGEWKDVKADVADDLIKITVSAPGTFELEEPAYKVVVAGKTDGSEVSLSGPTIPPGASATYKAVSPKSWVYTRSLNGKLVSKGEMTILTGGRQLADANWLPGKESEKSVAIYMKQ